MRIGWMVIGGLLAAGLVFVLVLDDDVAPTDDAGRSEPRLERGTATPDSAQAANAQATEPERTATPQPESDRTAVAPAVDRMAPKLLTPLAPASIDEFEPARRAAVNEVLRAFQRSEDSPLVELAPVTGLVVAEVEELGSDWAVVRVRAEAPGLRLGSGLALRVSLRMQSNAKDLAVERGLPAEAELEVGQVRTMLVVAQVGGVGWIASARVRGE